MVSIEPFAVESTTIGDLTVVTAKQVTDSRGTIREFYRESDYRAAAVEATGPWLQVNVTETVRGAIRGLHGERTTKLVGVAAGEAFGVYLDARPDSTTFGTVVTRWLRPGVQIVVPPGVCNGFQAVSDPLHYLYCFDDEWRPDMDGVAITPFDPDLAIDWPVPVDPADATLVSEKDRTAPRLAELADDRR